MKKKVELLAPAGDKEALRGAINAGADAVYLAGKSYGARAYADNFTEEEIMDALSNAHLFGVKIYLTANTLTRQSELPDLVAFVSRLYDAGLDGVIVQDLGVAAELRRHCPGLPLHASTQMSIMGTSAVRFLQRQGFTRVVPARELSLQEIRQLKQTGIEVETFIHGAMCYSCSGRCLMSSFLGGRSGNRGRCAGTCRLPYEILDENGTMLPLQEHNPDSFLSAYERSHAKNHAKSNEAMQRRAGQYETAVSVMRNPISARSGKGRAVPAASSETYPLSMKDLCALPILPELMDAGIDSFKIEGRMKKAEYVAGVTAIYRKYIDRFYEWDTKGRPGGWQIEQSDLDTLHSLYIRTDLSTGYYHERGGRDMVTIGRPGYGGTDSDLLKEIHSRYLSQPPRRQICGTVTVQVSQPIALTVTAADERLVENDDSQKRREADDGKKQKPTPHGYCMDSSVQVIGPIVQLAQQHPLTEETIRSKLSKTGDSPFYFQELSVKTDGQSFLPVSELNELRRQALQQLKTKLLRRKKENLNRRASFLTPSNKNEDKGQNVPGKIRSNLQNGEVTRTVPEGSSGQGLLVMVMTKGQAQAALESGIDALILDGPVRDHPEQILSAAHDTIPVLAALPHLLRSTDVGWMEGFFAEFGQKFYGFVTRNLEEVAFLQEREYDRTVIADSSLYCWNRPALESLKPYCGRNILPLELDQREIAATFSEDLPRMILPVYGRAPLMISANCIRRTAGRCRRYESREEDRRDRQTGNQTGPASVTALSHQKENASLPAESMFYHLKDRTGAVMPVYIDCLHCQNVIYNSVPTSLLRSMISHDSLTKRVGGLLLGFTSESAQETKAILQQFQTGSETLRNTAFTYGHYRKGAQ